MQTKAAEFIKKIKETISERKVTLNCPKIAKAVGGHLKHEKIDGIWLYHFSDGTAACVQHTRTRLLKSTKVWTLKPKSE